MKNKKILNVLYIYGIAAMLFTAWLLSYLVNNEFKTFSFDVENIGFIVIGVIAFLVIAFIKDSFYMVPLICLAPFSFARSFDMTSIPTGLFVLVGCALLGVIVHLIIYRTKLNKGVYFYSLLIFCIGISISGILSGNNVLMSVASISAISIGLLVAYVYIVSYLKEHEFSDLCHIMTALGIMLILESMAHELLFYPDALFSVKEIHVGWGISNNVALMLLMCFPFTIYLSIKSNFIISFIEVSLAATEFVFIVLNYSRGAMLCAALTFPVVCIYAMIKAKRKILYIGNYLILLALSILFVFVLYKDVAYPFIKTIFENEKAFNISTLNGRTDIYKAMLEDVRNQPIFGKGLVNSFYFGSLDESGEKANTYLWGHNAFIHTIYTCGIVGLITFIIHLFDKYYKLLKKPSPEKIFACLALLASGLYGLMDVAYYFINWMMVLITIMILMEYEIRKGFYGDTNA